ncbi:MAG: DUF484 family protein [Deltaproteobacteria bacterium]|nr:DUF484 family protein [Deltaproteobacteria bacterium]
MPSKDLKEVWRQAVRNEQILVKLEMVEDFLLGLPGRQELLEGVCDRVAQIYGLEVVTLGLAADHGGLAAPAGPGEPLPPLPPGCFWLERQELRLLLGDLASPYLDNRLDRELTQRLFPGAPVPASAAILPLWSRGQWLGSLNLGSRDFRRYTPDLGTDFTRRLAAKLARALDASLLLEENRRLEQGRAAMETAGAVCHEMAQPLTALSLKLEKMRRLLPAGDPLLAELADLQTELDRLGGQVARLRQVKDYVTKPYARGTRIVDLTAAGEDASLRPHPQGEKQ